MTAQFCYGYEFTPEKYNPSINFIPYFLNLLKEEAQFDWFRRQTATFNGIFQSQFAMTRTKNGMGYTFNMMDAEELLNLEK